MFLTSCVGISFPTTVPTAGPITSLMTHGQTTELEVLTTNQTATKAFAATTIEQGHTSAQPTTNQPVTTITSQTTGTICTQNMTTSASQDLLGCGPPPVIAHAWVTEWTGNLTTVGSTATYACKNGYSYLSGNATIECLPSLEWSELPTCHRKFFFNILIGWVSTLLQTVPLYILYDL